MPTEPTRRLPRSHDGETRAAGLVVWPNRSHERAVERFYSHGVHDRTDIHRGYLNFGLWEEDGDDYLTAAERLVHRLGTMLGLDAHSRLLDVACGMGSQDVYLRRTFGVDSIDGVDVTWRHVVRAERRAREAGLDPALRFRHGSATALPFADGTFTHLLSIEGPEHFDTRRRFFAEAHRVLRPGGVMCLADYTIERPTRNPVERALLALACRLWQVPRANHWTVPEYRAHLEAAGFTDCILESAGARTFPGYYREQCRPAFRREMRRLNGRLTADVGHVINVLANWAYRRGLVDYVLVRAVKPASPAGDASSRASSAAASRRSAVSNPSLKRS